MRHPQRSAGSAPTPVKPMLLFLLLLASTLLGAAQDSEQRPEGWFTVEQAEEGRLAYLGSCARCHSRDLNARSNYISLYLYPSLRGAYFMDRWEGESVHTLYQVIRHTMPLDAPGTLDEEAYADIVAYILQENGFPAGDSELPVEPEGAQRLRGMFMEPASMVERPQAQSPATVVLARTGQEARITAPPTEDQQDAPPPSQPPAAEQPNGGAWFTEAQAMGADERYVEHCARCHGLALQGVGVAPSLVGGNFIDRWAGQTVGDLFMIASVLMPLDGQGELEEQTYADLLAYILWRNGFPSGENELAPDQAALETYVITAELAEVPEAE